MTFFFLWMAPAPSTGKGDDSATLSPTISPSTLSKDLWELTGTVTLFGADTASTVSLSFDGRVIAARNGNSVQCYEWRSQSWQPRGSWLIPNPSAFEDVNNQQTMVLSTNGTVLAFGDWTDRTVLVFDWNEAGGTWESRPVVQLEEVKDTDMSFSYTLALSSNGSTLAVGIPQGLGKAELFEWNAWGQTWTRIKTWQGRSGRRTGSSVALSSDGRTIAIGAVENAISTLVPGMVRVYRREREVENNGADADNWIQVGQTLVGLRHEDRFGYMLALSDTGQRVAVGSPGHDVDSDKENAGQVGVYEWDAKAQLWNHVGQDVMSTAVDRVGQDIMTAAMDQRLGTIVSISASGNVLLTSGVDTGVQIHRFDVDVQRWILWSLRGEAATVPVSTSAVAGNGRVIAVAGKEGNTVDTYQAVGW